MHRTRFFCFLLAAVFCGTLCGCSFFESALDEGPAVPYDYPLHEYITVGEYAGLELTTSEIEVTQEQLTAQRESDFASYTQETARITATGDTVNLNYEAAFEGESYGDDTENGFQITLGENALGIPGFDEGVTGVLPGDSVELSLRFPEDYTQNEAYAGKDVLFVVTVNYIVLPLPELTDEMVRDMTVYQTRAEYEAGIKESLFRANKITILWQRVLDGSKVIQYPEKEYNEYYEDYLKSYENLATQYNMTMSDIWAAMGMSSAEFYEDARVEAQNYVKEDLIVYSIAREQNISVSEEEYRQGVEDYYNGVVSEYYLSSEIMEEKLGEEFLRQHILSTKVLDFVVEGAVVKSV